MKGDTDDILRYHALVDSMNDAFGVVNIQKEFVYVNKRFAELLKYTLDDLIGRPITDFMDEKNRAILLENIKKREQGHSSQYEVEWIASDGSKIQTIVSGAPLVDDEGNHRGSYAVVTDISKLRKVIQALERSKHLYRSVLEAMDEGLLIVDPGYKITYANHSIKRILGYSDEELIGAPVLQFMHEDEVAEVDSWIKEPQKDFSRTYEVTWKSKAGNIIHTLTTPRGIFDSKGNLTGALGVIVDVTGHKKMLEALKSSEMRYRMLFNETPFGLITLNTEGDITGINRYAQQIIGSSYEKIVTGRNILSFPALVKLDIPQVFKDAIMKREIREGEINYTSSDNRQVYLQYRVAPIIGANDEVEGVLVAFDDVSDVKQAEEARRQSEANYRTLAEESLQGLTVIQDRKYAYVNPAFAEIVGYTQEEILAMSSEEGWNLIYPDDKPYLLELAALRREGKPTPCPYEYRFVRKDGTVRWVEAFAGMIVFGGKPATQIHVIDITERKSAEMKLKASQKMLQLVMDNIPQFIFWKDTSLVYLGCNENYAKAAGVQNVN